jgi:hypothetical protein
MAGLGAAPALNTVPADLRRHFGDCIFSTDLVASYEAPGVPISHIVLLPPDVPNENTGNIPNEKIRQLCSSSGGSLHLSAICWQTLAVSLRTSNTTRSMLRRVQDRHAARTGQAGSTMRSARRRQCRRSFIDIRPAHRLALLLHQAQLQHLGLDLDVISISLTAPRRPPLTPQETLGDAALVEREAVTLPLDHAFGFELADVRAAAIEVQRQCRPADGRSPVCDGRAIYGNGLRHRVGSCCVAAG